MLKELKLRVVMSIFAMALPACPSGAGWATNGHTPNQADDWGPPTEGFALSVQVIGEAGAPDRGPQLRCTLKNVSKQIIRFVVGRPEVEFSVSVTNEKGERAPLTQRGALALFIGH